MGKRNRKKSTANKRISNSQLSTSKANTFKFRDLFITVGNMPQATISHQWHAFIVFIATLVIYLITMPTLVTYEDGGVFNLLCHYGQPMHPPGYPLYSMLCYPFTNLPFLSVAHWGSILSALCGALACSAIYLIAMRLVDSSHIYGYLAGLSFGFSQLMWSQSIIQEVYTLHTFLIATVFLIALVYNQKRDPQILKWLAVFYGLALANHWPMTVLASPAILVLIIGVWKDFWRHISCLKELMKLLMIVVACAVLPYLYIWALSFHSGPVSFYDPLNSWDKFIIYVMRSGYGGVDNQLTSVFEKMLYAKFLLSGIWVQFGYIFTPFLLTGFIMQWVRWRWSYCFSLLFLYIGTSFLLLIFLNFRYTDLFESVFSVYQISAYASFAIWATLGVKEVMDWVSNKLYNRNYAVHAIGISIVSVLVVSVLWSNFNYNNRSNYRFGYDSAITVLNSFEPNAVVLTSNDFQMPLIAEHILNKVRPDITLYNVKGLVLSNRLTESLTTRKAKTDATINLIKSIKDRPIYYYKSINHGYGVENYGIYKKVRKDWPEGKTEFVVNQELFKMWDLTAIQEDDISFDAWVKRTMRTNLVKTLLKTTRPLDPEFKKYYYNRLDGGGFYDVLSLLVYIFISGNDIKGLTMSELIHRAEQKIPNKVRPRDWADFVSTSALTKFKESKRTNDDLYEFMDGLSEAIEIYPATDNLAINMLLQLYGQRNEKEKFERLITRHPSIIDNPGIKKYKDKFDKV